MTLHKKSLESSHNRSICCNPAEEEGDDMYMEKDISSSFSINFKKAT